MTIQAYPLQWPAGWPRHNGPHKTAAFRTGRYGPSSKVGIGEGIRRVRKALERMKVPDWNLVISTNLALRLDGFPRADQREPTDSGAAVYWKDADGEMQHCMAIDQYARVADNLAAIAATLEALRAIERYGGAKIVDRAFTGFTALEHGSNWRTVLGFDKGQRPTRDQIELNYRQARSRAHPDKGGDANEFSAVESAYADALREIGA